MADNINLGEFKFDASQVNKQIDNLQNQLSDLDKEKKKNREENKKLNKSLKELAKEQKELTDEGKQSTEQYKRNEKQVGDLNDRQDQLFKSSLDLKESQKDVKKEYKEAQKASSLLTDAQGNQVDSTEAINSTLNEEVNTIEDLREQNKKLNTLRNKVNISTDEGKEQMEGLNDKLNTNNQRIVENVDGLSQQKINVGNYEGAVEGLSQQINLNNGLLGQAVAGLKSLRAATGAATAGTKGLTKASITFIATGFGAVLAAIGLVIGLVANAMDRSEESGDKLGKIIAPLTGIFQGLLKILEPLGDFILDVLVDAMETMTKVAEETMERIASALEFLGFDDSAESLRGFTSELKEASKQSRELTQMEQDLGSVHRANTKAISDQRKELEAAKETRDDDTKSIEERREAAQRSRDIVDEQLANERKEAELQLEIANKRISIYGESTEALDEQAEALSNLNNLEAKASKERRKETRKSQSLNKEVEAKREKAHQDQLKRISDEQDAMIESMEIELELFEEKQGFAEKTASEELAVSKEIRDQKIEILREQLETEKITRQEYQLAVLQTNKEFAQQNAEITIDNAKQELEIWKEKNQSLLEADDFLSDELLNKEKDRLDKQKEQEKSYQEERLDLGLISQEKFNEAIDEIDEEFREKRAEAEAERNEAEEERLAIDKANELEGREQEFMTELEHKRMELERQRQLEIDEAEKTGADLTLINEKYAQYNKEIDEEVQQNKIDGAADTLAAMGDVLGQESAVGKAVAIAGATIDTYQAANAAYAAMAGIPVIGPALGIAAAAAAVGSGLANVSKIAGLNEPKTETKAPKAEKGAKVESVKAQLPKAKKGTKIDKGKGGGKVQILRSEKTEIPKGEKGTKIEMPKAKEGAKVETLKESIRVETLKDADKVKAPQAKKGARVKKNSEPKVLKAKEGVKFEKSSDTEILKSEKVENNNRVEVSKIETETPKAEKGAKNNGVNEPKVLKAEKRAEISGVEMPKAEKGLKVEVPQARQGANITNNKHSKEISISESRIETQVPEKSVEFIGSPYPQTLYEPKLKAEKGTTIPDSKGANVTGSRHSKGGEMWELEEGEVVINRYSTKMFPELLSEINQAGGGIPLAARGGSVGTLSSELTSVQAGVNNIADNQKLAETLGNAVRDGSREGSSEGSYAGSQDGIEQLSSNRRIAQEAEF